MIRTSACALALLPLMAGAALAQPTIQQRHMPSRAGSRSTAVTGSVYPTPDRVGSDARDLGARKPPDYAHLKHYPNAAAHSAHHKTHHAGHHEGAPGATQHAAVTPPPKP